MTSLKLFTCAGACAALLLAAAPAAFAGDEASDAQTYGMGWGYGMGHGGHMRFAAVDQNGDDTITPWEFRAHRRMF